MELIYLLLYIALIVGLVFWFRHMIEKEIGSTDLNWKMTLVIYCAAFGLPSIVIGIISLVVQGVLFLIL